MAYTVSKLRDYSEASLRRASGELLSALGDEAAAVTNEAEWKIFRDRWMGRKDGILAQVNDLWLKAARREEKRDAGRHVNLIKEQVEEKVYQLRKVEEVVNALNRGPERVGRVDISLPGVRRPIGAEHPVIK